MKKRTVLSWKIFKVIVVVGFSSTTRNRQMLQPMTLLRAIASIFSQSDKHRPGNPTFLLGSPEV